MKRFSFSEKVAITAENSSLHVWSPKGTGNSRLFTTKDGNKAVLRDDGGRWWQSNKKEAANCYYAQFWLGKYPWSSWCWAIRQDKETKQFNVQVIATDINPSGLSEAEKWESDCKAYASFATA